MTATTTTTDPRSAVPSASSESAECIESNDRTWSKLPLLKSFVLPKKQTGAENKEEHVRRVLLEIVASFPPESNGLALGLCGASAVALELQGLHFPGLEARRPLMAAGGIPAALIWILFGLRCCLVASRGQMRTELSQPKSIAAYAAWGLVYLVGCGWLKYASPIAARFFFYLGTFAQPVVTAGFLRAVWTQKPTVEPYFNPAVVNPVVVTIVGCSLVGRGRRCDVVINVSFILAALATCVVVPLQLKNVLWIDHRGERPVRTVAVMQAPLATVFVACGVLRRDAYCAFDRMADVIFLSLFAASLLVTWLTAYAVYVRRRMIFDKLSPDHASFTFPSCASATAAIVFAADHFNKNRPFLRRSAIVYSLALSVAALAVTVVVAARLTWRAYTHAVEKLTNRASFQQSINKPTGIIPIADLGEGDTVELPCPRDSDDNGHEDSAVSDAATTKKGCHAKKLLDIFVNDKDLAAEKEKRGVNDDHDERSTKTTSVSSSCPPNEERSKNIAMSVLGLFQQPPSTTEERIEHSPADSTPAKLRAMRDEHLFPPS